MGPHADDADFSLGKLSDNGTDLRGSDVEPYDNSLLFLQIKHLL
jgi:hypothetical protein